MKHLKKFESYGLKDVKDICQNYLAFIKDDGYTVKYLNNFLNIYNDNEAIDYDKIKSDFIPFIQVVNDKYDISVEFIGYESARLRNLFKGTYIKKNIDIDKLINDRIRVNYELRDIRVKFTQKMPGDVKKFLDNFVKNGLRKK